ncbi:MAG: GspE/PulE family protein [Patescibacteria group bacterium]
MRLDEANVKYILLKQNYISVDDATKAELNAKKENISFIDYLIREQYLSRDLLGQAIAESYGIEFVAITPQNVPKEYINLIPEPIARHSHIVVIAKEDNQITIATDNPKDLDPMVVSRIFPGAKIKYAYTFSENIENIILKSQKKLEVRFAEILKQKTVAPSIIEEILADAMSFQVSDIHFEPGETIVRVRFRIDGMLEQVAEIPKDAYANVLRVVKLRANLSTDEHTASQDGAIRLKHNDRNVDLRISIVPTIDGEKIVIRLLSEYVKNLSTTELGLSSEDQALIMKIAKNPFGLILTVGPTGSGKTTTLYSILKMLNRPDVNVTTIEDPVEYKIPGVNHIQVNENSHLTFAQGLRSIVRQDPNIILVGEIRDKETAEIAANAALTGHLVLSSFHANDAATAFPRLLDMGIEPFLLSSTLEIVIGQRLVRKICDACRYSYVSTHQELTKIIDNPERYFSNESVTLYRGKGCALCNSTGFKGRIAVFEIVYTTPELQSLILKSPSTQEVWKMAKSQGAHSMFDDGLIKVKNGITTLEELLRVVAPAKENIYNQEL